MKKRQKDQPSPIPIVNELVEAMQAAIDKINAGKATVEEVAELLEGHQRFIGDDARQPKAPTKKGQGTPTKQGMALLAIVGLPRRSPLY